MIRRLLIANRGEIACRIARTCARMGIEYVGVYSEADAASPHLRGAVAKSCIGPPIAAQSYLDQKRIIGAAREGRGVVHEPAALRETIERAMRVARAHFADGRLILERYLDRARHVEVQIFGDSRGNVVHLYERECSLQRR